MQKTHTNYTHEREATWAPDSHAGSFCDRLTKGAFSVPRQEGLPSVRLPFPWCSDQGGAGSPLSLPNVHLDEWIHQKENWVLFFNLLGVFPGQQRPFYGYVPQKWFRKGCKVWPAVLSLIDDFIGYEGNQAPWSSALSWIWGSSRPLSLNCTWLLTLREGWALRWLSFIWPSPYAILYGYFYLSLLYVEGSWPLAYCAKNNVAMSFLTVPELQGSKSDIENV